MASAESRGATIALRGPPWAQVQIIALVHGYFQVDWNELWNVVERDLEPLRKAITAIVAGDEMRI